MSEIAVAAGVDTDPLDVSFVVIASNEAAHVAATTAPIPGQENLGHHVIVVVEDGSTDATAAVVERLAAVDRRPRLLRHGAVSAAAQSGRRAQPRHAQRGSRW
ncbi:MAG: glycosyltransferase [Actinomycetota bacterium]|nr:glycosyltransferase [Actinomycetota bacterium]